jgi:hypothetical protein
MWQAFELIHATFKSGAELYLEDMLPALENFVNFGVPQLLEKPEYVDALYGMVSDMFTDGKVGGVDRICACKLAEAMMLSLPRHIDNCVIGFVTMAMNVLAAQDVKIKSYKIHLMEMVINAIYYNPVLTLQILEAKSWTNKFFSLWFGSMESFTRVHDKKLCIVAIVELLSLPADQVPASISVGWPRLLQVRLPEIVPVQIAIGLCTDNNQGITQLFKTLPAAIKSKSWNHSIRRRESSYMLTPTQVEKRLSRMTTLWTRPTMGTMMKMMSGAKMNPLGQLRMRPRARK